MSEQPNAPFTIRYHAGNPNMCRIPELDIKEMHECEGGGWYLKREQAEMLVAAVNASASKAVESEQPNAIPLAKMSDINAGAPQTPWAVRQDRYGEDWEVYPKYDGPPDFGEWSAVLVARDYYDNAEAIAQFVVRCVNSHSDMLTALEAWVSANAGIEDHSLTDAEAEARRLSVAAIARATTPTAAI